MMSQDYTLWIDEKPVTVPKDIVFALLSAGKITTETLATTDGGVTWIPVAQIKPDAAADAPVQARKNAEKVALALSDVMLGTFVIFVLCIAFTLFFSFVYPPESSASSVYNKAIDAVRKSLKSPATAQFAPYSEATISGGEQYGTVKGWVDSQNSFGAMLRSDFEVEIVGGQASVKSLTTR